MIFNKSIGLYLIESVVIILIQCAILNGNVNVEILKLESCKGISQIEIPFAEENMNSWSTKYFRVALQIGDIVQKQSNSSYLRIVNDQTTFDSYQKTSDNGLFSNILSGYLFLLADGSKVYANDIRDIEHLISLLPIITVVMSDPLIDWLQSLDEDYRRAILIALEYVPVDGDSEDNIRDLLHFIKIEKEVERYNQVSLKLKSGEIIDDLSSETLYKGKYYLSRSILRKSMLQKFEKAQFDLKIYSNEVMLISPPEWTNFNFWGSDNILDLVHGCIDGDIKSIIQSSIFLGLGIVDGILDVTDFVVKFMSDFGGKLFENISGIGTELISIAFSIWSMVDDIKSITSGTLGTLELVTKGLSLTSNIVSILFSITQIILLITGATAWTGITAIIGAVLSLIFTIIGWIVEHFAKKQGINWALDAFASNIYLTQEERDRNYKNLWNDNGLDEYLVDLNVQKGANTQLINAAFQVLVNNTIFEIYVFPALVAEKDADDDYLTYPYANNKAFLNLEISNRTVDRWVPDSGYRVVCDKGPKLVNVFECVPINYTGTPDETKRLGRPCEYAFAIRYEHNRSGRLTLFDLKEGDDEAYGSEDFGNIFLVGNGKKNFVGGNKNDTFILQGNCTSGILDAGIGNNTLYIVGQNVTSSLVKIDLVQHMIDLGSNLLKILNFQILIGREDKTDELIVACDTQAVVLNGGLNNLEPDKVIIPDIECSYSMTIQGNRNMEILNLAKEGTFVYSIPFNASHFNVDIKNFENSTHVVRLEYAAEQLLKIQKMNNKIEIFSKQNGASEISLAEINPNEHYHSQPVFVASDNSTVRVDKWGNICVIFNITQEKDTVSAVQFGQSIFFVHAHVNNLIGWDGNDTFILENSTYSGLIDGKKGENQIILGNEFNSGLKSTIWFNTGLIEIEDISTVLFSNVKQISGRKGSQDVFKCACETTFVNTEGSIIGMEDIVEIPKDEDCFYEMSIRLGENTILDNMAEFGDFFYLIPFESGMLINAVYSKNISHVVYFEFSANSIFDGVVLDDGMFYLEDWVGKRIMLPLQYPELDDDVEEKSVLYYEGPFYLVNDTAIMRIDLEGFFHFIFNLTIHKEKVEGAIFAENVFIIQNSTEIIVGGKVDDMFIMNYTEFTGTLDGAEGVNRLVLQDYYHAKKTVMLDFNENANNDGLIINNIQEIVGRNGTQDIITCGCNTFFVDGVEGSRDLEDLFVVPNSNCSYNIHIVVRNYSIITNYANVGSFLYTIIETSGDFDFISENNIALNHTVLFPLNYSSITNVTFNEVNKKVTFYNMMNSELQLKMLYLRSKENKDLPFFAQPKIFSQDLIEFKVTSEGEPMAIFNVPNNGNQAGFAFIRNTFLLHNGSTFATGGDYDDTFVFLGSNETFSVIDGNAGNNTLVVNDAVQGMVEMLGQSDSVILEDMLRIHFVNISSIYGRVGSADKITADCNVRVINSQGGESIDFQDQVIIPNLSCNYTERMNIVVNNYTKVSSDAQSGYFYYAVTEPANFSVNCSPTTGGSSIHVFALGLKSIHKVQKFHFNKTELCSISITTTNGEELTYGLNNSIPCTFPRFLFGEELLEVSFGRIGSIRGNLALVGNETKDEILSTWSSVATLLNMTLSVFNNKTQEMFSFSKDGFDMLWNSPNHTSYLVGNKHVNSFIIIQNNETCEIPDVKIYSKPNSTNLLDLNLLIRPVRQAKMIFDNEKYNNPFYLPALSFTESELRLSIQDTVNTYPVNITLINFLDYFEKTTLIMDQNPMHLEMFNGQWKLVPSVIEFNQTIMVIDQSSFEEHTELYVQHDIVSNSKNVLYSGNDLIVTNIFNSSDSDFFTMVVRDYFYNTTNSAIKSKNIEKPLPKNVHINITGLVVGLDLVETGEVRDLLEVLIEEKQKLSDSVFGFVCFEEGLFPDKRRCRVYHQCIFSDEEKGFIHYEFTCPTGTVFCNETGSCGYETNCPCTNLVYFQEKSRKSSK